MSATTVDLSKDDRSMLVKVLRTTFPHDRFPDGPYERTADAVVAAASASSYLAMALTQGLRDLANLPGGSFRDLDEATATDVLTSMQATQLFALIRTTGVVALYDDAETWELLGYQGPSFDRGGYVDRGFDDLDWLPDPRITEYEGEDA